MKYRSQTLLSYLLLITVLFQCSLVSDHKEPTLQDAIGDKFLIGTALNAGQIRGNDSATIGVVKHHFNSIVAENIMKSEGLQPSENNFNFSIADEFVAFGEENGMHIHGHTLIWHSQTPRWFFTDSAGNDVSREVMIERMKNHITTVVSRYKGRVHSWDVVNEAIEGDGSFRQSRFYKIIGEDFIKLAFQFAQEADPDAKLYYNDYSMTNPRKREGVINMVKSLQSDGVKIDGIGMQGHIGMDGPSIEEFEKSILAYSDLGVQVSITELDMSVLPFPRRNMGAEISENFDYQAYLNPYSEGLPDSVSERYTERYMEFFKLFDKHADKIERVTLWGVNDGNSWKNNWPVPGRTDYPLLFDRQNQPKPIVAEIIKYFKGGGE